VRAERALKARHAPLAAYHSFCVLTSLLNRRRRGSSVAQWTRSDRCVARNSIFGSLLCDSSLKTRPNWDTRCWRWWRILGAASLNARLIHLLSGPEKHSLGLRYIYVYMCVCVCVCIYIYIYIFIDSSIKRAGGALARAQVSPYNCYYYTTAVATPTTPSTPTTAVNIQYLSLYTL